MAQGAVMESARTTDNATAPLEAAELTVQLGGRKLGPFGFTVGAGELVCLLGGNGSGKTTAIRLSLGLVRATSGSALIFGRPVSPTLPPRGVGYVPDRADFWNWESAAGNLLPFASVPEDVAPALERVGLAGDAGSPVRRFSRGMRQRLSIARGLIADPQLLVMDEPTIALDVAGVDLLLDLVAERQVAGRATLLATHDQGFLDRLNGLVVRVEDGQTTSPETPA